MLKVNFYEIEEVDDELFRFAVILSAYQGSWLFCKHKERDTWECPGGRRESGELMDACARRELYEETGAEEFLLRPVCAYSVIREEGAESYGILYFARIDRLGELPKEFEMERIGLFSQLPDNWTYPEIQPYLLKKAVSLGLTP